MPTARPFASNLEQKARQLGWSPDEFYLWLISQGYSENQIEEAFSPTALREIVEPSFSRFLPQAAATLGWSTEKLGKRVRLEVVNADTVQCHVHLNEGRWGKQRLRVYAGFLFFMNKVVRAWANGLLKDVAPPIPRAEEEAAMLLRAFSTDAQLPGAWAIQPYELNSQQEYTIAIISGYIRDAAIAHELGHILYTLGRDRTDTIVELAQSLEALQNQSWGETWVEEFAADFLAMGLLRQPEGEELASAHGLVLLLFVIELLEEREARSSGAPAAHPPSTARRGLLWHAFPRLLASGSVLSTVDATCRRIAQLAHH